MHGKVTVLYVSLSFEDVHCAADVSVIQSSEELGLLLRRSEVATSSNNVDSLSACTMLKIVIRCTSCSLIPVARWKKSLPKI